MFDNVEYIDELTTGLSKCWIVWLLNVMFMVKEYQSTK